LVSVAKDGKVELPAFVHPPEGAEVRVNFAPEASVLADIARLQ